MIIKPPQAHKCPKCSDDVCIAYIASCNTIDARFWTDGRVTGDILENEWLVKCYSCGALLWSDELEKTDRECPGWNEELKKKDYLLKLKETTLNKEKTLYLRIKAWRTSNDKRRDSEKKKKLSKKEIKNLKALDELLDYHDDNDRIMKAEINRELGRFEEAKSLLEKPFDEEFSNTVSTIKELIDKQDPFVAEIKGVFMNTISIG